MARTTRKRGQPSADDPSVLPSLVTNSVFENTRSIIQQFRGWLVNSDKAYRSDRTLQRSMRHDPDVMAPLWQRYYAVSLLEWDIIPEDHASEEQRSDCDRLKKGITKNLSNIADMLRHLEEAVWFGTSGVNLEYRTTEDGIFPVKWRAIHPDSIAFDQYGNAGLRVGYRYEGEKYPIWDGWVHPFTDIERQAVVLNTFNHQGPDYEDMYEARYLYAGRGVRDIVWPVWMMKQTALQLWMTYIERYSMGIRLATYPSGNDAGKAAMEEIARNLVGDVTAVMPRESGSKDDYSVSIMEPNGVAADIFGRIIEKYLAAQLKELIVGQPATSESISSGLGSEIAKRHFQTFMRIIKFDALNLQQSLTKEFIKPLAELNGIFDWVPTFAFSVEDVDAQEFMSGVETYVNLGGSVSMRQVRDRLGIIEPAPGEPTLVRSTHHNQTGTNPVDQGTPDVGSGSEPEPTERVGD